MSNIFLWANDAASTLAAPISNTATALTVASGSGALFPDPSTNQQFELTMNDAATGLLVEIIYVQTTSGDTFSNLLRGQEGTAAQNWFAGDLCANLLTAGTLANFLQSPQQFPARILTTSGAFTITTADAYGRIGLNRTVAPAVSSAQLPSGVTVGQTYAIDDLAGNFSLYPVTITPPAGMTIAQETSIVLNVNRQSAIFAYCGSNVWSVKL